MTSLPDPVEATFVWRHRTGTGLRDIPITVTWRQHTDRYGRRHWTPVKFTVDGGYERLSSPVLSEAPWTYAINATNPENAEPKHEPPAAPEPVDEGPPTEVFTPLEWVETALGVRAYNSLRRNHVESVEEAMALTDEQLLGFDNMGAKSLTRIRAVLGGFRMVAVPLAWVGAGPAPTDEV